MTQSGSTSTAAQAAALIGSSKRHNDDNDGHEISLKEMT